MLAPNFCNVPVELQKLHRWVVWKGAKIPYCPALDGKKASVSNPLTWAPFDDAKGAYDAGGFDGVGFVLNGDGLVGIDFDKCVTKGQPDASAMQLMDRIGCHYVELSPSGTGLRGFGFAGQPPRNKGEIDGVNVELYGNGRYLTVTGHVLKKGPLVNLPGFSDVASELGAHLQKNTEDDFSHPQLSSVPLLVSSVGPLLSSVGVPATVFPTSEGERNKCLFALVRFLKGAIPGASRQQLRSIAQEWHETVLPIISTKDFATTWTDFWRGWHKVKQPHGEIMNTVMQDADQVQLPDGAEKLGYGAAGLKLIRICAALQDHHREEPFFISARQAGELVGVHFTDASKMLSALVLDGVIELVSKGSGRVASRYRMERN